MYAIAACLILALIAWLATRTRTFTVPAAEIEVIDGDTVAVAGRRMRLHGLDAPEWRQAGWRQAASYLKGCLRGVDVVTVRTRGRDRYGRRLVTLIANGVDLNFRMVMHGHAVAYSRYSRKYLPAMRMAQAERRGIWSGDHPIQPERFRQARR